MNVFTIWREQSTGGFVLVAGDRPPTPGDTCFKRIDCATWKQATAELHRFMDQRQKDMATS